MGAVHEDLLGCVEPESDKGYAGGPCVLDSLPMCMACEHRIHDGGVPGSHDSGRALSNELVDASGHLCRITRWSQTREWGHTAQPLAYLIASNCQSGRHWAE
jgi:hypothetical protein